MEQLTKEQLLNVKEQLMKVIESIQLIAFDYSSRLKAINEMIEKAEPTVTINEKKEDKTEQPAESPKA